MNDGFEYVIDIFDPKGDELIASIRLNKKHVAGILRYLAPADDPEMRGAVYPIEGFLGARAIPNGTRNVLRSMPRSMAVTLRSSDKAPSHK